MSPITPPLTLSHPFLLDALLSLLFPSRFWLTRLTERQLRGGEEGEGWEREGGREIGCWWREIEHVLFGKGEFGSDFLWRLPTLPLPLPLYLPLCFLWSLFLSPFSLSLPLSSPLSLLLPPPSSLELFPHHFSFHDQIIQIFADKV